MAGATDVTAKGEVVDGEVLVRTGETITREHADRAEQAGILHALVVSAAGSTGPATAVSDKLAGAGQNAEEAAIGKSAAREIALARRLCAERGMQIGLDGVQLLGGHGFVKEHPVERWYRDLRAIGIMEGTVLV